MINSRAASARANNDKIFQAIYLGASQSLNIAATATQTSAFLTDTSIIRVFSTSDCYIDIGATATASTSKCFLPAGMIEYFGCESASKISVIQASATGILYITEGL